MSEQKTEQTEQKTEQQHMFEVEKDVPLQYRRQTGDKNKPEVKGRSVRRQCKNCLWWKIPMPGAPKQTEKGAPQPCSVMYSLAPDMGPTPDWFRCHSYLHREHRNVMKEVEPKKSRPLRAIEAALVSIEKIDGLMSVDEFCEAMKFVETLPAWKRQALTDWVPEYIALKAEKAHYKGSLVTKGSAWLIKDEMTGTEVPCTVASSTLKYVKMVPDTMYRKKYGESWSISPDRFEQIAKPIIFEEEDEELLEEDQ
jgi:hypothetical protein